MRRFAMALAILASGAGLAVAQTEPPPQIVNPQDTISLAVGQAQKLIFEGVFDRIDLTSPDVVQAKPLTDRVMTLQGLAEGEVIMTVMAGSKEIYTATIIVGAERGHVVRVYGGKSPDYAGFYCTDTFCGRADKELNGAREFANKSESVSVQTNPDGSKITTETKGRSTSK